MFRNTKILIALSFLTTSTFAQQEKKLSLGEQPVFKVSKVSEPMVIDGKMDEASWSKTEARTLDYFYRVDKPTDQQKSTFRMLWGKEKFYVFFEMEDQYITARETKRDGQPYLDDCAEIFFITTPDSLDTHFGYELNLNKAVNDFIFFNDYVKGKDVAYKTFNPDFEVEVTYDGTINDNSDIDKGWTMEMAIPYSNFGELGKVVAIEPGNKWAFLAIRQDRNDAEGDRRSTSTIFPIYDISKNVHQANRFGLMEFVE
ncbi:carbohydrate-binding family 9-like protein [Zobellia barbeyronii]|uniref:Carbohydrate-binding family 9-like protein n=1 Tax=Zobellia barbeyronii TaxID=2748009 RepID=A0ABS5WBU2_9FLAO|nr:carbohydrate-binding family 9-like protein [Zobellia barbeyronii]MBT2160875.1 carbohydrate-binding family 9-like protein [Zobellia barbeyronii]